MKKSTDNRLNIFIDETGEFGFGRGSARFYGISLVLHEQKTSIHKEVETLERKLGDLGFHVMIHMGDLVTGHGDFVGMTIAERRKIYNCLYRFSTQVKARYRTIIIDKKNARTNNALNDTIEKELRALIYDNLEYIQGFDKIFLYYDGGQIPLNKLLNKLLGQFGGYRQKTDFDHTAKKLFQVADMLTYVDKIIYKYTKRIKLTATERTFFKSKEIRTTVNELRSHRF